jgi:hypothetical protein
MLRSCRIVMASTLVLAFALAACDRESEDAAPPPPPATTSRPPQPLTPARPPRLSDEAVAAVETFLAGGLKVPERLAAGTLRLTLRSNVEAAVYECRTAPSGTWQRACVRGDQLVVERLADGNAYHYEVRAVSTSGRADQTPLIVSFVVDLAQGEALTPGVGAPVPEDARELPEYVASPASPSTAPRSVALGRSFAAVVPFGHRLSSYATDLTYNGRLKLYMAMETASAYGAPTCDQSWERIVEGPGGAKFCDATPTAAALPRHYRRPLPRNHLETFGGTPASPDEKLFLAAFSDRPDEADAAEARLDVEGNCRGATRRGSTPVPLLAEKLGGQARDLLDWCLVRGEDAAWWWIGGFKASAAGGQGRLVAIYAVKSSTFGLQSSQDFVLRTVEVMKSVLAPLGVSP